MAGSVADRTQVSSQGIRVQIHPASPRETPNKPSLGLLTPAAEPLSNQENALFVRDYLQSSVNSVRSPNRLLIEQTHQGGNYGFSQALENANSQLKN